MITLGNDNNQFIFHVVQSSAIKRFIIIDIIAGTGIYWTVNFISSNALLAIISCFLGTKTWKNASFIEAITKSQFISFKFVAFTLLEVGKQFFTVG